ncbi:MAG: glycosyltransferase [bacterium]|nr:glycosyltransferase [bacterium]
MRIALVHDALNQLGGAEYVVQAFHSMFPHAPIFTLVDDGQVKKTLFPRAEIKTSFLQRLPGGVRHYKWYLPLHPTATEQLDLSEFDVVLSDSSSFAKGVITKPGTLHVCYCHTPTRYLWHDTHDYTEDLHHGRLVKVLLPALLSRLRIWDQQAAHRVDKFIANSYTTAARIKKYYRRDSTVIYPPVAWQNFYISESQSDYYLMVGRLRPYKKHELAVRAFNRLGLPLVIAGDGEEYSRLRRIAGPNITFVRRFNDQQKAWLFAHCQAFVHPQEEDLGIVALEAMASGRPVIAYGKGGALETVIPGLTGAFFKEQSEDGLIDALRVFEPDDYDPGEIRAHAEQFNRQRFEAQIWQVLLEARRERAQRSLMPSALTRTDHTQAEQLLLKWQ